MPQAHGTIRHIPVLATGAAAPKGLDDHLAL
jgi:hypothetical protein